MKRALMYFVSSILLIYYLFTIIAPPFIDKDRNRVIEKGPYTASPQAQKIFDNLNFVADLHCDALLWNRKLHKRSSYGHVDFPRMQEGNVSFQAFTIVSKSPKGQNFNKNSGDAFDMCTPLCIGQCQSFDTWFGLKNRVVYQCKKLKKFARKFDDPFIVVKSRADFQNLLETRKNNPKAIGGLLGIEGAHCLEGNLDYFDEVYEAGVRMLGPAHFFDNEMGGSAHGIKQEGLTQFGFQVLGKMQSKNMIMDVAHSSSAVIKDILENYKGPILSSHTGVRGVYDSPRNLSDTQIKGIAAKGGLVGIGFFEGALGDTKISSIVKTMKYVRDLVGVQHVALGSDFDGSVTTPFDCTGFALIVDEMLNQGFTQDEIKAIMGENVKDFMTQNLPS